MQAFLGHLLKATYSLIKQIILFYGLMCLLLENTYGSLWEVFLTKEESYFIITLLQKILMQYYATMS